MALLVGLIQDEIRAYTDKIEVYQTQKPDILFENAVGQKIALEIETGKGLKKHKSRTDTKFREVRKEYGDRAYIILTDMRFVNSYVRHDLKILGRNQIIEFVKLQFSNVNNSTIGRSFNFANDMISGVEGLRLRN